MMKGDLLPQWHEFTYTAVRQQRHPLKYYLARADVSTHSTWLGSRLIVSRLLQCCHERIQSLADI